MSTCSQDWNGCTAVLWLHIRMCNGWCGSPWWRWNFIVDVFSDRQATVSSSTVILLSTAGISNRRCSQCWVVLLLTTDSTAKTSSRVASQAAGSCDRWWWNGINVRWCSRRQVVMNHVVEVNAVVGVVLLLTCLWWIVDAGIAVGTQTDAGAATAARLHGRPTDGRRRMPDTVWPSYHSRVQVSSCVVSNSTAASGWPGTTNTAGDSDGIRLRRCSAVTWNYRVESTGIWHWHHCRCWRW